jgi:cell division protein FtsB
MRQLQKQHALTRQNKMTFSKILIAMIGLVFSLVLLGCGQSKIETENANLKGQISKSELENKQLETENDLLKTDVNLLQKETNALSAQIKDIAFQANQRKIRDKCFQNIWLVLKSIMSELDGKIIANSSNDELKTMKERIKADIDTAKKTIPDDIATLEQNGESPKDIETLKSATQDLLSKLDSGVDYVFIAFDYEYAGDNTSAMDSMKKFTDLSSSFKNDADIIQGMKDKNSGL